MARLGLMLVLAELRLLVLRAADMLFGRAETGRILP